MFNEIYGTYFHMMQLILEKAALQPISVQDIQDIVVTYGFAESNLHFLPEVLSQDGSGYNLLQKSEAGYASILQRKPVQFQTLEQRRFLKTMLQDQRISLFLTEAEISCCQNMLQDIPPLYHPEDIKLAETAADQDPYADPVYQAHFRQILAAIQGNYGMKITYHSSHGIKKIVWIAPYKLEYALRDDKFRLCGVSLSQGRPVKYIKLNMARIIQVQSDAAFEPIDFERFINQKQIRNPVTLEISDFRNGFERIFIGLSNYRRTSSYNPDTGKCMMQIFCLDDDLQELLITVLSYGPAVKVIGPDDFKQKYIERIRTQIALFEAGK